MTIRTKVCGAALLVGALGAVVPLAAAGGAPDRDLRFRATQTQFAALDNGPSGSSLGDVIVYADDFTDDAGRRVGRDGGTCITTTMLDGGAFSADCVATLVLQRGEITVHGEVTFASPTDLPPFTTAITGGTGAYQGAAGELRGEPLNATDYRYTVHFAKR